MTPFDPQKQQQLINVFVDATAGNLSASQFTVLLVSSAFSSRHRSLLQAPIVVRCSLQHSLSLCLLEILLPILQDCHTPAEDRLCALSIMPVQVLQMISTRCLQKLKRVLQLFDLQESCIRYSCMSI